MKLTKENIKKNVKESLKGTVIIVSGCLISGIIAYLVREIFLFFNLNESLSYYISAIIFIFLVNFSFNIILKK